MSKHKSAAAAVMEKPPAKVVNEDQPEVLVNQEEIAKLAYSLWERRGFQGGSPEEDWLRAEEELRTKAQQSQN